MSVKTILLVDDDPNILDTVKDILEDAGYRVEAAESGAAALQKLKNSSVDVAVFDLNLPDAKGVDLAVEAKRLCPKMAIILMTGEENVDLGLAQTSIDSILTKPVSPDELIRVIQMKVEP